MRRCDRGVLRVAHKAAVLIGEARAQMYEYQSDPWRRTVAMGIREVREAYSPEALSNALEVLCRR